MDRWDKALNQTWAARDKPLKRHSRDLRQDGKSVQFRNFQAAQQNNFLTSLSRSSKFVQKAECPVRRSRSACRRLQAIDRGAAGGAPDEGAWRGGVAPPNRCARRAPSG
jgi:hypothetical protein